MKAYWDLYIAFFRIGLFTFGGGLTMLPMLKKEVIEKNGWLTEEELLDCYAIGQCTPGIIAVNTATFVGYKEKGVMGGIIATAGMVSPSFLIITLIASFLSNLMDFAWVGHALMGIRGGVCALMLNTVLTMAKKSLVKPYCYVICIATFVLAFFLDVPTVLLVVLAGLCGVFICRCTKLADGVKK